MIKGPGGFGSSERSAELRGAAHGIDGSPGQALAPGGQRLLVDDPWTGEIVAEVPLLGRREALLRLEQVARAQREWGLAPLSERLSVGRSFVRVLESQLEDAAREISLQMGKPLYQARNEVRTCLDRARTLLELAPEALAAEQILSATERTRSTALATPQWQTMAPGAASGLPEGALVRRITREPLGVVLVIAPWNYPLLTAVNVVLPAVLAGNGVLIKHSARTPLCADRFADVFQAAGAPPALVASLPVDHQVAAEVMGRQEIGHVSFIGSPRGGREVSQALAQRFIDVGLELGGKDAAFVAEDSDLEFAAENLVDGAFYNAGQSCCGVERIYVHEAVYDRFVEKAAALARAWQAGDPRDETTTLGPMALPAAIHQLSAQVADARARGGSVICGGEAFQIGGKGRFFAPTVVAGASHEMALMRDESFGPVVGIARVSSDAEAILLMNDSPFGLTASVWTSDLARAMRVGGELDVGTVYANRCDYVDPALPWSGTKESGKGVSLSHHGFTSLTRPKSWHLRQRSKE